tara:strand:+ start:1340 stop:1594 length:255 start_codon:yes stop_codon:yes gene_type:complete
MKFYYFQDSINGYDSHLFSTKRAALDWIRHADKTYLEEGNDTFEEHDMQILYVSTHNKKSMLKAMRNASMIVGTRLFTPEVDHD